MKGIVKAGAAYFGCVFAAGFVVGAIRVDWVVPRLGLRAAELLEMPVMLAVMLVAARTLDRRGTMPGGRGARVAAGVLALVFMLLAELVTVLWLSPLPLREYLARRDPVSGTAYVVMLVAFALVPALAGRIGTQERRARGHLRDR
jgi:hypothetical protein